MKMKNWQLMDMAAAPRTAIVMILTDLLRLFIEDFIALQKGD